MSAKTSSTLTVVLVVLIIVAGVAGYFAGSSAVPPPKTVTITTTVGTPTTITVTQTLPTTVTVTVAPTPTPGKVYKWRVPVSRLPADPLYPFFQQWAELVRNMSNGRLIIEIYAPGELFPVGETLDAVARGTVEAAVTYVGYWLAQDPVLGFVQPALPAPTKRPDEVWLYHKLFEDIFRRHVEKFGVKYIGPLMFTAWEILMCRIPIRSLDDLNGKIIRSPGLGTEIYLAVGAKAVALAVGEIFTALQQGTIDCLQWSDYLSDYKLGFHEVAKYVLEPPINGSLHEASFYDSLIVNPKVWNELPDDLKTIVKVSMEYIFFNAGYQIYKFNEIGRELMLKAGVTITTLSPKDSQRVVDLAIERIYIKYAKVDPDVAKICRELVKFWRELGYTDWADKLEKALRAEGLLS